MARASARQQRLLARVLGEGVVALELGERAVVGVDVGAGRDVLGGEADDLAELEDRLRPWRSARAAILWPRMMRAVAATPCTAIAGLDAVDRHDDVVARIEPQRARGLLLRPSCMGASRGWCHDGEAADKGQGGSAGRLPADLAFFIPSPEPVEGRTARTSRGSTGSPRGRRLWSDRVVTLYHVGKPEAFKHAESNAVNLSSMLRERAAAGRPVRIGQVGAGKFGTMFLSQVRLTTGMHLVGLADLMPGTRQGAA